MTTMPRCSAAFLLAIGHGAGSELRQPLVYALSAA